MAPSAPTIVKPGTVFGIERHDGDAGKQQAAPVCPGRVRAPAGGIEPEPRRDPGEAERQHEGADLELAEVVERCPEHELDQVERQHRRAGGERHDQQGVGAEGEENPTAARPTTAISVTLLSIPLTSSVFAGQKPTSSSTAYVARQTQVTATA